MPMSQRSDGSWYYCPPEEKEPGTLDLPKKDRKAASFINDDINKNRGKATRSRKVPVDEAWGDGED